MNPCMRILLYHVRRLCDKLHSHTSMGDYICVCMCVYIYVHQKLPCMHKLFQYLYMHIESSITIAHSFHQHPNMTRQLRSISIIV